MAEDRFGLTRCLSPIAQRSARALAPLFVLACCAVACSIVVSMMVRDAAIERLTIAQGRYEEARRTQRAQEASRRTQEEIAVLWKRLPIRTEFTSVVLRIEDLARENHISIPGIGYAVKKTDDGLAMKGELKFQSTGDYASIRRFIQRLERTGPYLFIESLDASRSTKMTNRKPARSAEAPVVFNVRVLTYLRLDAEPVKGTPAKGALS